MTLFFKDFNSLFQFIKKLSRESSRSTFFVQFFRRLTRPCKTFLKKNSLGKKFYFFFLDSLNDSNSHSKVVILTPLLFSKAKIFLKKNPSSILLRKNYLFFLFHLQEFLIHNTKSFPSKNKIFIALKSRNLTTPFHKKRFIFLFKQSQTTFHLHSPLLSFNVFHNSHRYFRNPKHELY